MNETKKYSDKKQGELALKALKNEDSMDELKKSLTPLIKDIIEKYKDKNKDKDFSKRIIEIAWDTLPEAIGLFKKNQKYKFGTFFTTLAQQSIEKYLQTL